MDSFEIRFQLRALDDIEPWGTPETKLSLSWFGLTDGWYDLVIAGHSLFRGVGDDEPGVGYQVVRLWEDLLEVAPAVLDEVPAPLAARVADADRWHAWTYRVRELDDADDLCTTALMWWSDRQLTSMHLRGAPRLELWRTGNDVRVRWHSRQAADDPAWSSPSGEATLDHVQFRDELVRFDRAVIDAMAARVDAVATAWRRPEIAIDVAALRREQADRATWLANALARWRPRATWDEVLAAVTTLEARLGSALG